MTRPMSHKAIEDLLGVYALDAVEADEAEIVDLHVRDCPRCRAKLSEFRETASLLSTGHAPAGGEIWESITAAFEDDEHPPVPLRSIGRATPRRFNPAFLAAAAALVLVIGGYGVSQERRLDRVQEALSARTVVAAALEAQNQPGARRVEMRSADGRPLARAVITEDGTGYLWSEGLPRLSGDRTYQLWAAVGTERISVGVLGTEPEVVPFRVVGKVVGLAITEEVAGGVVATKNQPTVTGLVVA